MSSSLKKYPIQKFFIHKKNAIDELNFRNLVDDNELIYLNKSENIKLLWEVCRIPDFEKIFNDNYLTFLKNIFLKLIKIIIKFLKIGFIKTFKGWKILMEHPQNYLLKFLKLESGLTFAYHQEWLEKPIYWQEKTQKIENDLSDNLHIGLNK